MFVLRIAILNSGKPRDTCAIPMTSNGTPIAARFCHDSPGENHTNRIAERLSHKRSTRAPFGQQAFLNSVCTIFTPTNRGAIRVPLEITGTAQASRDLPPFRIAAVLPAIWSAKI